VYTVRGAVGRRLKAMNAKREMLVAVGIGALALGQQAPAQKPNELVVGKLIYVEPMPDGLDQWIIDSLHHWGKYKVTSNAEGVDLVIQATNPEKELQLETRAGTAQPRGADRPPSPIHKGKHDELPATSISVIDWVTNQPVWHADILDRKPKKDETTTPAGPQTKIFARAMTTDQIGQRVMERLREYEEGLEKSAAGKN
jgi:hypothetical protein